MYLNLSFFKKDKINFISEEQHTLNEMRHSIIHFRDKWDLQPHILKYQCVKV